MTTYKLFRIREGRLYPLYVEYRREVPVGVWLEAGVGEKADETHVKGRCGLYRLRPGWHSTTVPFADWIGKKGKDGRLYQRPDTVWCECEVEGKQQEVNDRNGLDVLPSDWYYFKTNSRQKEPWIISNRIMVRRILSREEVAGICMAHGLSAQPVWKDH